MVKILAGNRTLKKQLRNDTEPILRKDTRVWIGKTAKQCEMAESGGGDAGVKLKWAFQTGGEVWSSPAVSSDGATVYVGSDDNKVYALSVKPDWEEARKTMILFYLANTNSPILILTDDAIKCIFQELCK